MPFTAGTTNSSSVLASYLNGEATWRTYSQPETASSQPYSLVKSADTNERRGWISVGRIVKKC